MSCCWERGSINMFLFSANIGSMIMDYNQSVTSVVFANSPLENGFKVIFYFVLSVDWNLIMAIVKFYFQFVYV